MSFHYAPDMDGQPAGWSEQGYASSKQALAEGRGRLEGRIWVAWVKPKNYAAQLPSARQLLAEMKERAAEAGADTSCFDALTEAQVATLETVLGRTFENWEAWLPAPSKSGVVIVENARRHEAEQ
jgi:hypothetical protein